MRVDGRVGYQSPDNAGILQRVSQRGSSPGYPEHEKLKSALRDDRVCCRLASLLHLILWRRGVSRSRHHDNFLRAGEDVGSAAAAANQGWQISRNNHLSELKTWLGMLQISKLNQFSSFRTFVMSEIASSRFSISSKIYD